MLAENHKLMSLAHIRFKRPGRYSTQPIYITAQIVELTEQLQGDSNERQVAGAQIGLARNGGGMIGTDAAATVVSIATAIFNACAEKLDSNSVPDFIQ